MESDHKSSRSILPAISPSFTWMDEDLVPEILKRLPVKSLFRFRYVCRSWKSLISSPSFIKIHYSSNSSTTPAHLKPYIRRGVFYNRRHGEYDVFRRQDVYGIHRHQIHFPFRYRRSRDCFTEDFNLIDLIQGIVCLCYKIDYKSHFIILWNPAIHKYINLPCQSFLYTGMLDIDMGCTGHSYRHAVGLGYDNSKNDFKVVRIWTPNYPSKCECKSLLPFCDVYSVREGAWRVTIPESIKFCVICSQKGCFSNGTIHWVVADSDFIKYFVLMFDCELEEFTTMELPQGAFQIGMWLEVLEYGGMLSVLADLDGHVEQCVMEEYGVATSWKKLYEISEDAGLKWNTDVSESSYEKLAPYRPCECIKFRWDDELSEVILRNNVYEESLMLINDTRAKSYAKEEIVPLGFSFSSPYSRYD